HPEPIGVPRQSGISTRRLDRSMRKSTTNLVNPPGPCPDDGGKFMEHAPTQFLGPNSITPALVLVQAQPLFSELPVQQVVLCLQVFDHAAPVLVQGTGERNQQEPKPDQWGTHRDRVTSQDWTDCAMPQSWREQTLGP